MIEAPVDSSTAPPPSEAPTFNEPPGAVLIVDDDPRVCETLVEIVELLGHQAVSALDADAALEWVRRRPFDVILTDLHMPGRSGLDLAEEVRRWDDTIALIVITGFPSVTSAVEAVRRGAIDFLPKPFDLQAIEHMLAKALRERRLRQENRRLAAGANKTAIIEQLNRELNAKLDELTRLYKISDAMAPIMETEAIFAQVVKLASQVTGARRVSLMLLDRARRHMRIRASIGIARAIVERTRVRVGQGIAGRVAQTRRPLRVIPAEPASRPEDAPPEGYRSGSWMSAPLFIGHQLFGVLNLTDKQDRDDFTAQDEHIIRILLEKAGIKLENQALYEGIYASLVDTLNALVTTLEAKDPYTRQHSHRVTEYALRIGERMNLTPEELEMIDFAGVLHDIGKIGVRDEILTKSGRLTEAEFAAVRAHPLIGVRIVEPLGLSRRETAIIRNHHERYDGRGYPDGLAGAEIDLLARILGVADAFDAMTTTRAYRRALPLTTAIRELDDHRGTQFDPDCVDAALQAIRDGTIQITWSDADDADR